MIGKNQFMNSFFVRNDTDIIIYYIHIFVIRFLGFNVSRETSEYLFYRVILKNVSRETFSVDYIKKKCYTV